MASNAVKSLAKNIRDRIDATFYLIDFSMIQNKITETKSVWGRYFPNIDIAYSFKTNCIKSITSLMLQNDLSAEVTSGEEMNFAIDDGFLGNNIYFDGPIKLLSELKQAIMIGASIQIDSHQEAQDIIKLSTEFKIQSRVLIRLAVQYKEDHTSRFGIHKQNLDHTIKILEESIWVDFQGFHMHVGSNIDDPTIYTSAIDSYIDYIIDFYKKYNKITINIGGGFPALTALTSLPLISLQEFAQVIARRFLFYKLDLNNINLVIEPGRSLVEDAGYLISPVRAIKKRPNETMVILDGGIHFLRSISVWKHKVEFARSGQSCFYNVYGSNCFELDIFRKNLPGPDNVCRDDFVIISGAGGYDIPSANVWTRASPSIYGIDECGNDFIIRKAQPYKDMREHHLPLNLSDSEYHKKSSRAFIEDEALLQLAPYVKLLWSSFKGVVGSGSLQIILHDRDVWEAYFFIAKLLKKPRSYESVKNFIQSHKISSHLLENAFYDMKFRNFIVDSAYVSLEFSKTYSRSSLYYMLCGAKPSDVIDKLQNSRVMVLGCGGIGSNLAHMLALSGVGSLILVDADCVELSNLARSPLFQASDVGRFKVDVIKEEILKRCHTCHIETIKQELCCLEDFDKLPFCDALALSADHPRSIIRWVNSYCVSKEIPYIAIGYINDIATVGPFYIPRITSCFACCEIVSRQDSKDIYTKEIELINADFCTASYPPVNAIAMSYGVHDILSYLGEYGKPHSAGCRIGFHSHKLNIETQVIPKNTRCAVCQNT